MNTDDQIRTALGDLANAAPAPPSWESVRGRLLRPTTQRAESRWPAVALVMAAVCVAVAAAGIAITTNAPRRIQVSADGTPAPSMTNPTTVTDAPADGRLRRSYLTPGYRSDSGALGNFRVDPAPDTLLPQSTEADVMRSFETSEAGSIGSQPGTTTIARFGLFTGNVSNPPASDGRLTGTHPVAGQPAWLILVDGVKVTLSGGPVPNPDAVATTQSRSDPVASHAVSAVSDSDGRLLNGLLITGGSGAALGIR